MIDFYNGNSSDVDYMHTFEFEKINVAEWRRWVYTNNYWFYSVGFLYLLVIHFGPNFMANRPPFKVKTPLIIWNALMAIFSIAFVVRCFPIMQDTIGKHGLVNTLCKRYNYGHAAGFWLLAFLFSKILELVDTIFLIIKKRKVIFLHWYHHLTIFLAAFYFFPRYEPNIAIGSLINATVHSIMYSYFFLVSAGFKIPKIISMSITTIQILQFIFIISSTLLILFYKLLDGDNCPDASYDNLQMYSFIEISYFILFIKFFKDSYVDNKKSKSKTS